MNEILIVSVKMGVLLACEVTVIPYNEVGKISVHFHCAFKCI